MKHSSQSTIKPLVLLFVVIAIFIGSGFYHIDKFETSDEHFWRLERIPQYWTALKNNDIDATYINDKPGVSIALISGTGLPFVSQNRNDYTTIQDFTMTLNRALRIPLVLFNGLVMLPLLYWLLWRAFDRRVASLGIVFIGINPILIGISQIINPDALLWSFSAGALFSFFALLKTNEKKFVILTGVLTGFALLSKYTANLLFVFYVLIAILWLLYEKTKNTHLWTRAFLSRFLLITLGAIAIFLIFIPAVRENTTLFFYGTFLSPALKKILIPLLFFFVFLIIDSFFFKTRATTTIVRFFRKIRTPLFVICAIPLLLLIVFALINAWTNASFITLDNLKEIIAHKETLKFPMLEGLPAPIYFLGEVAIQSFNLLFALTPAIILSIIVTLFLMVFHKIHKYRAALLFVAIVPFLFFVGGIVSEVFVNTRYAIILVPLFALMASIGISHIVPQRKHFFASIVIILLLLQGLTVYFSAPYYFNYQNIFLPKKFVLTDSWGYGVFEAAQYLNALPNAKNLTIWSDRKTMCHYFIGNCITRRKIDAQNTLPDYFVITRRGVFHHHFKWLEPETAPFSVEKVYTKKILDNPLWEFDVLNRPQNYIKIIKVKNIINNQ